MPPQDPTDSRPRGRQAVTVAVSLKPELVQALEAARRPGESRSAQFAALLAVGLAAQAQPAEASDRLALLEDRVDMLEALCHKFLQHKEDA